jgi:hypothetical protein
MNFQKLIIEVKKNIVVTSIIIISFLYFWFGFFFQHDFTNGGKIDHDHIYNNFLLFKEYSIFNIPWERYESTSLPIHYIITKFLVPIGSNFLKIFTFLISNCIVFLIYLGLKEKYRISKLNLNIFLLSSVVLVSSSFRNNAFFGLEQNIGFLFFCLSMYFFFRFQNQKKFYDIFFTIFFTSLCFYARQTYAFLSIIIFFSIIDLRKIYCKKNIIYSLLFFLFLSPSLYFFYKWGHLIPPGEDLINFTRIQPFNINHIPIIFSHTLIFTVPFIIFFFRLQKIKFTKRLTLIAIIFYILYLAIFINSRFNISFGSGPIFKFFFMFQNIIPSQFLSISFGYIGLLFSTFLILRSVNFFIYIIITLGILVFADTPFFSYFDPLFFLVIIFFIEFPKKNLINSSNFSISLFLYFLIFHFSWIAYYKLYIGNVIR